MFVFYGTKKKKCVYTNGNVTTHKKIKIICFHCVYDLDRQYVSWYIMDIFANITFAENILHCKMLSYSD